MLLLSNLTRVKQWKPRSSRWLNFRKIVGMKGWRPTTCEDDVVVTSFRAIWWCEYSVYVCDDEDKEKRFCFVFLVER